MVPLLSNTEVGHIRDYLEDHGTQLGDFMIEVVAHVNVYASGEGKSHIRFVMPRTSVKSAKSVIEKIDRHRLNQEDGSEPYGFNDVTDLVGSKILCAYPSDVQIVLAWLRRQRTYLVSPPVRQAKEEALERERLRGYRGYHFILKRKRGEARQYSFELQVKTLLEEAWDAKTHDVSYKPSGEIQPAILDHMKLLSKSLVVVDDQSEVLKQQIQIEEKESSIHYKAAAFFMLSGVGDQELLSQLGFPSNPADFKVVESSAILGRIDRLTKKNGLVPNICRYYALLALLDNRAEFELAASIAADDYARLFPGAAGFVVASHVHWALRGFQSAIAYAARAIEALNAALAELDGEIDAERIAQLRYYLDTTMNQFVYWVCDARDENLKETASGYLDELGDSIANRDTLGFFKIVFGGSTVEIDEGRRLIREARELASEKDQLGAEAFFLKHELIAQRRLEEIFRVRASDFGLY